MKSIPASAFILSYNAEETIAEACQSVLSLKDIVVVDSGSTDKTLSILKQYPVRVIHQHWLGYSKQKAFAASQCRHDWVFNLDSDECVDSEVLAFLAKTMNDSEVHAVRVKIKEHFLGVSNHPWTRHGAKIRAFRRSCGNYGNHLVHEGIEVRGKVVTAPGFVYHFGEKTVEIKVEKINRYSSLKAQEQEVGMIVLFWRLLLSFPLAFFKSYLLRRQFMNGLRGFIAAMINGFYAFLKAAKCYEKKKHL